MPMIFRSPQQIDVRKISPNDTNYFAILIDPEEHDVDLVCVIEIFTVGGSTPPNVHDRAHEIFYVLSGEGIAHCNGNTQTLRKGDTLLLRPGAIHQIVNTGPKKLYTLTTMVPDENFAALIRNGEPVTLDEEDLQTITGSLS